MLGHQVSRIDSIVITHGHADAILGLDDAREWTEDKVVPVYARDIDMAVIKQTFPYLANRENARVTHQW
jgi:phosphoribosyl 1,2-cyclic phosphodiesterase